MDAISPLFQLLALLYIFRGAQVFWRVVGQWGELKQEPLSKAKKSLAGQAAFFIAVPPSVIVHEFFHAVAIWFFGGRVVQFGFTFYGGYVVPDRMFAAQQQWIISIAGTIGSLIFGICLWLLLRNNPISSFRYFGLRAFRVQLLIALVFYPLLALGKYGDWAVIYDFGATPVLSGVTAVLHILTLALFYRADRTGWFEMAGFETGTEQVQFAALEQQAALNPQDKELQIKVMRGLVRGDAPHKAIHNLKQYLKKHPHDAGVYAILAALQTGQGHVPAKAKEHAEKALKLGVTSPDGTRLAHQVLGEYALERNRWQTAVDHFSNAISTVQDGSPDLSHLYRQRSLAHRRQGQYDQAYQDMAQAVRLAQAAGQEQQTAVYQQELHIIEQQAGRPLGSSHNPRSGEDVV